jgi:glycosyltransferase involved in cell wall biosynthesis
MKKTIVISGINMTQSGLQTILQQCLQSFSSLNKNETYRIIALVPEKFQYPYIEHITFPLSKKSWFLRIYYEWIYFYFFSKNKKIHTWISLHDISPNVIATNKITYFHNPCSFYKAKKIDWKYDLKIALFSKFYIYLYQINSKKLKHIIVQQQFIKKLFEEKGFKNILVAKPILEEYENFIKTELNQEKLKLIFPSEPKVFKNHIIVAEALNLLPIEIQNKIEIYFTFTEKTNKFSKYYCKKYKHLQSIKYLGWLSKNELYGYYQAVDALLFPSKLETWGLPISEIQQFQKPIVISNLDFAKESIGNYDKIVFFNPENENELAEIFKKMINNEITFKKVNCFEKPDFEDWENLTNYLISL